MLRIQDEATDETHNVPVEKFKARKSTSPFALTLPGVVTRCLNISVAGWAEGAESVWPQFDPSNWDPFTARANKKGDPFKVWSTLGIRRFSSPEDASYFAKVLINHHEHHQRVGFSGTLVFVNEVSEAVLARIPKRVRALVAAGGLVLVRWSVFPAEPPNKSWIYWAYDQILIINSALLMAKRVPQVVLLSHDYDEFFIPLDPFRSVNEVMRKASCLDEEQGSGWSSLSFDRMDAAVSWLAEGNAETEIWNTSSQEPKCHPLLALDSGMWHRLAKPIIQPQHIIHWNVHTGKGSKQGVSVSRDCARLLHVFNIWGQRHSSHHPIIKCMQEECDPPVTRIHRLVHSSLAKAYNMDEVEVSMEEYRSSCGLSDILTDMYA